MKSFQMCLKALMAFSLLCCMPVSDLLAKKPDNPRPPKDDPCLSLEEFTPSFAFYRDTGQGKNPTFTFFVADAENGCEKALFEFSRMDQMVYALTYSATRISKGHYLGRIVWRMKFHPTDVISLWSYDFKIVDSEVLYISGPDPVMNNEDNTDKRITRIDLSPDRMSLAYNMYTRNSDEAGDDSIRMVHVDTCIILDGCNIESDFSLVLAEPGEPEGEYVESPAWGPLGERVYYRHYSRNEPEWWKLQYIDLPEGWNGDWSVLESFEPVEATLVSIPEQSDFPRVSEVAGGFTDLMGVTLAVQFSIESECGHIGYIDVEACVADQDNCSVELMFFGSNPSLTREGMVIHNYMRDPSRICNKWGGTVGLFDGTQVSTLLKGFMPDAAGGIPWE